MAGELKTAGPGVTAAVAAFAAGFPARELPAAVRHEAKRALVNGFATALAGWDDPALRAAGATFARFRAPGGCTVVGRAEPTDAMHAASLNAMAVNVFDFDDTHLPTVIHPTAPVMPAVFAWAQTQPATGAAALAAFALGLEVQCRLGDAVSPWHYARGWHITATCGVFGAAVATGALLGLDETRMRWALGNAAAQSSGLVETLGSMAKSVGVGNAAANGLRAALLAMHGFEGPAQPLEGPRGFLGVMGEQADHGAVSDGLGQRWSMLRNTFKPYPCGVVLNPVIEACLALHHNDGLRAAQVAAVELVGHPLLRQRTDRPRPASGREAQVSAQHAVAMTLANGLAGLDEFSDAAVATPEGQALAGRLRFTDDERLGIETAEVRLTLHDGRTRTRRTEAARGSLAVPLSDDALDAKLRELCRWGGSGCDPGRLADTLWSLETAPDAGAVMALAAGRG